VTAHHGQGLAKEQRFRCRAAGWKGGKLKALVRDGPRSSLGIDHRRRRSGLPARLAAPQSRASCSVSGAFGPHAIDGTPKGKDCSRCRRERAGRMRRPARTASVAGELDRLAIPSQPLGRAGAADRGRRRGAGSGSEDELFSLVRRAWPYRALEARRFQTPSSPCWRMASIPAAAGAGVRSFTTTPSMACCAAGAVRG